VNQSRSLSQPEEPIVSGAAAAYARCRRFNADQDVRTKP
jgi:hypothetical protein